MNRSPRIFVATDLSAPADEAIRQADERARAQGAALLVCHVIPNIERVNPLFPHLNRDAFGTLSSLRERALETVIQRVIDLTMRTRGDFGVLLDDGVPHATIVEKAEEWGADLVVVGGHGTSGLFGGTAQKVIRYAHCPVLVARSRPGRGRILAATDFSDAALPALAAAGEEARRVGAAITAIHAVDFGVSMFAATSAAFGSPYVTIPSAVQKTMLDSARTMLEEAMKRLGIDGDPCVVEGTPTEAITRTVIDLVPELLVMGTSGLTGLRRVLLGSVAESVVQHATCPVLIVRLSPGRT